MHSKIFMLTKVIMLYVCLLPAVFADTTMPIPKPTAGTIQRLDKLYSESPAARTVDVWLPPGYSIKKKYAVLYMHDGQMLFDANLTWNKQEWRVDESAARLMAEGKVRPFIVVGVHNNSKTRHSDYFPQKPFDSLPQATRNELMQSARSASQTLFSGDIASDAYLKFLVDELKPYIDGHFSVYIDAENTAIMGSSMGALISLYAISEYPEVFGSAACISTHWPGVIPSKDNPMAEVLFGYMRSTLPDPVTHRLYFDYGTETLDAFYPPLQAKADVILRSKGYNEANWLTRDFVGADHSEKSWAARLDVPLQFLFGIAK
jgi:enterochelin esterase-like enzyme